MLDFLVYNFPIFALAIIILFIIAKVVLFVSYRTKNWNFFHLLHFPFQNIKLTSNVKRQKVKKLQNTLTAIIIVLAIVFLLYKFLFFPG